MKNEFFHSFIIILFLCVAFFNPQISHAQKIKDLFQKKMPEYESYSQQEFESMTYEQEETPFGDKFLAYKIRLPNGWEQSDSAGFSNYNLSTDIISDVSIYYSEPRIDTARSRFELKALKLEYEVTAEQWMLKHILANGYTLEGLEYFDENKVGALYIYVDEGETYVVRSIAQINGRRMIVAQYVVPASYWQKEKRLIAQSLGSFKLLNPERFIIEKMQDYLFLDIAKFQYPQSWEYRAPPVRIIDRMEVTLNNIRQGVDKPVLDGQINMEMISSYIVNELEQELNEVKLQLRKKGLLVGEMIETVENVEFSDSVEFGFVEVFEGTDTKNNVLNYEVWIAVFVIDNYYVFSTLITPHRDNEFFTWSRNTTTFKNVLKSLEMQNKKITLD